MLFRSEYACRAGTDTEYSTGDGEAALREAGWHNTGADATSTKPVGLKVPNALGLYDMHGNVDEWCRDAYDSDAYKKRVDGIADPEIRAEDLGSENPDRVIRGGSWAGSARYCRSAYRCRWTPDYRSWNQGFRVCLVPGPVPEQSSETEAAPTGDAARR